MSRPRVVLDTNVLLSALLFPAGSLARRAAYRRGR
jgi:predicted nucleic acid-binding protein